MQLNLTQRQVALWLFGLTASVTLLLSLDQLRQPGAPLLWLTLVATIMFGGLFGAYVRGWEPARYVAIAIATLMVGLTSQEVFVTHQISFDVFVPPALALVLATPRWIAGSAATTMAILILRGNDHSIYLQDPVPLIIYGFVIGGMILACLITDTALRKLSFSDSIVNSSHDAIIAIDAADGTILSWNPSAERLYGRSQADAIGHSFSMLLAPEHCADFSIALERLRAGERIDVQEMEHQRGDGPPVPVTVSFFPIADTDTRAVHRLASIVRDISQRKQTEAQLFRQTFYDEITALPNRNFLLNLIGAIKPSESQSHCAVLVLGLDRFKIVQESFGPQVRNQLLAAIARRLEAVLRHKGDSISYLGGESFAVLLDEIAAPQHAMYVAERLMNAFQSPIHLDGHDHALTACIGITTIGSEHIAPADLLHQAEVALSHAQLRGPSTAEYFAPSMMSTAMTRLTLEEELRRALQRNELTLYYQPIVSLTNNMVVKVEALARWNHPERGFIPPSAFIPIAEESDLIVELGTWCLRTACRQAKAWHDEGLGRIGVSVNIAARQFRQPNIRQVIKEVLATTQLPPASLELELTERSLVDDTEQTIELLHSLRALGIQLSIDDFGTGFSCLSYLQRFPLTSLKIDRSFVWGSSDGQRGVALVKTLIDLAHNLKLEAVAEGVETPEQLSVLRDHGCDYLQGYLYARPLPAEAMAKHLAERRRVASYPIAPDRDSLHN